MSDLFAQLVAELETVQVLLLLVVDNNHDHELKYEYSDFDKWAIRKMDGGTRVPRGLDKCGPIRPQSHRFTPEWPVTRRHRCTRSAGWWSMCSRSVIPGALLRCCSVWTTGSKRTRRCFHHLCRRVVRGRAVHPSLPGGAARADCRCAGMGRHPLKTYPEQ